MVEKAANKSGLMRAKSKELTKCQTLRKTKDLRKAGLQVAQKLGPPTRRTDHFILRIKHECKHFFVYCGLRRRTVLLFTFGSFGNFGILANLSLRPIISG
jgi:hypothetical protein